MRLCPEGRAGVIGRSSARRPPAGCGPTISVSGAGRSVARVSGWASDDLTVGPPPGLIRAALAREWREGGQFVARASRRIPWSRPVRARCRVACKPDREGAPNTRMKLTVAMHSVGRDGRGVARDLVASGRPQLMRHPLGGRSGAMRAPSHALLPRAFPAWRGARVGNESRERLSSCGVSIYGPVVAPGEAPSWA